MKGVIFIIKEINNFTSTSYFSSVYYFKWRRYFKTFFYYHFVKMDQKRKCTNISLGKNAWTYYRLTITLCITKNFFYINHSLRLEEKFLDKTVYVLLYIDGCYSLPVSTLSCNNNRWSCFTLHRVLTLHTLFLFYDIFVDGWYTI